MDPKTRDALSVLATVISMVVGVATLVGKLPDWPPAIAVLVCLILVAVVVVIQWDRVRRLNARWPFVTRLSIAVLVCGTALLLCLHGFAMERVEAVGVTTLLMVLLATLYIAEHLPASARLTTRYLGEFPRNMPALVEALESARYSIFILTDVFAYGAFSAPALYKDMISVLDRKKSKNRLDIVWRAYDTAKAESSVKLQLALAKIIGDPNKEHAFLNSPRMEAFLKTFEGEKARRPRTVDEFLQVVLHKRNTDATDRLQSVGCKVREESKSEIPLYIWLIDSRLALFSVQIKEESFVREDTFITEDPVLVAVLEGVGQLFWSR